MCIVLQNSSWQSLTPGTTVADYLSHLPANTLPLSLHHFLKYSAENIKKENSNLVCFSLYIYIYIIIIFSVQEV